MNISFSATGLSEAPCTIRQWFATDGVQTHQNTTLQAEITYTLHILWPDVFTRHVNKCNVNSLASSIYIQLCTLHQTQTLYELCGTTEHQNNCNWKLGANIPSFQGENSSNFRQRKLERL